MLKMLSKEWLCPYQQEMEDIGWQMAWGVVREKDWYTQQQDVCIIYDEALKFSLSDVNDDA